MHTILYLETYWSDSKANQPLKKTLIKSSFCCFFAHNNWTQLTMITNQYDVFCSLQYRYECLRFCGLSCFIDENLSEPYVSYSSIECSHTCSANHVCRFEYLILCLVNKIFQLFFLFLSEFTLFFPQLN